MNLRIVTFLNSSDQETVKELIADFSEALVARGFSNDIENDKTSLQSLIILKENNEIDEYGADEYFATELEFSLLTVIPTDTSDKPLNPEITEGDGA